MLAVCFLPAQSGCPSINHRLGRIAWQKEMRKKLVLVVDDNEHERTILSRYLEFVGASPLEAADGAQGLQLARETHPDLILLDLRMPVMDGWETIRQLKAYPETRPIQVVALTGTRLNPLDLYREGFSGHLEKPSTPFRVVEEVERCIGSLCRWAPDPPQCTQETDSGPPGQVVKDAPPASLAPGHG